VDLVEILRFDDEYTAVLDEPTTVMRLDLPPRAGNLTVPAPAWIVR